MKYTQRDIVEINFLFPDGTTKPHPAVIISNDDIDKINDLLDGKNIGTLFKKDEKTLKL